MGWIADLLKEIPSAARYKSELEAMERENAQLKTQIQICQTAVENLRQEIQRRDDIIQKEKSHIDPLEEIKVKLLFFLSTLRHMTLTELATAANSGIDVTQFHLDELKTKKMVSSVMRFDSPPLWTLTHEGRRYLIENGLIA